MNGRIFRCWQELMGSLPSPTRLGKEIAVFIARIDEQTKYSPRFLTQQSSEEQQAIFNAHKVAYPEIDWVNFADSFVK